jgi:hypothetical protein
MKNTNFRTTAILALMVVAMIAAFGSNASAFGKKYAVFVGINDYPGNDEDLTGAVNDAQNMKKLLTTRFGFQAANTTILLDSQATRENILGRLQAYGAMARLGDELVFQYSGHGTLFPDIYSDVVDETSKTEVDIALEDGTHYRVPLDYYDSAIVPWNSDSTASGKAWRGLILDDELYALFSTITGKGATVVFIADSCHSGTIGKNELKGRKFRFMSPERALKVKSLADGGFRKPMRQIDKRAIPPNFNNRYIVLSAANDDEVAWDGGNPAIPGGLFTSTLIQVINATNGSITYTRLMDLVKGRVSDQHPRLDGRFGNVESRLFEPVLTPIRPVKKTVRSGRR